MDKNHLKFSKITKKVILTYLRDHYDSAKEEALYEALEKQYEAFLIDMPNLGGKKNGQAQSVYDCVALFALYEVVPEKPSLGVFEELVNQVFVPQMKRAFYANLNFSPMLRMAHKIFWHVCRKSDLHRQDWVGNYHMSVEPFDPEVGIRYHFTTCPVADFARKHGYTRLMPAMCNPDYPTLAALQAGLIRTKTCATDDCCDYWIVGSRSPHLKNHPQYRDPQGYIRNNKSSEGRSPQSFFQIRIGFLTAPTKVS